MSTWSKVGDWLKDNAGSGAALVGSLVTGNVPATIESLKAAKQASKGEE